jgi:hypothetical protein
MHRFVPASGVSTPVVELRLKAATRLLEAT